MKIRFAIGHIPGVFTADSAFVALDVALGQNLVTDGACDELTHQLENKDEFDQHAGPSPAEKDSFLWMRARGH